MTLMISACRRFVAIDGLHVDRDLFETLARWAAERDVRIQDALQLALCAFVEAAVENPISAGHTTTPGLPCRPLSEESPCSGSE